MTSGSLDALWAGFGSLFQKILPKKEIYLLYFGKTQYYVFKKFRIFSKFNIGMNNTFCDTFLIFSCILGVTQTIGGIVFETNCFACVK